MITSKERLLQVLNREKPDRLPATIHQWQQYHLDTYMGVVDALTVFKQVGLDAAIQYFEAMGQFWRTKRCQGLRKMDGYGVNEICPTGWQNMIT